ncbi:MAG: hypothetical protein LBB36_03070 [Fibromonadaceae bacterium]|nr:hypothetical protein [Fibromonadaceae bacterium]
MWKRSVFSRNLRLTLPFFEKAGVRQPEYGEVLRNMLGDAFDFVFRHPGKNARFEVSESSIPVLEEMRRGGLFLTAHYGNHEILGYRLAELALPLNSAAQEQKPEFFERWLKKKRTFGGKRFAKKVDMAHLMEFIDGGGLFALLADQDFRKPVPRPLREKCEGEFLGVKVRCNPLPAFILEHRRDVRVFCGVVGANTLFLKELPSRNFYAHYHSWLEGLILENPAKWYGWFHGRFSR